MNSSTSLIVALAALVPGVVAWWTGRRIARLADDPALPEILLGQRQRALKLFAGLVAFIVVFGGRDGYWAIPLLVVVLIAGSYPIRRTLGFEAGGVVRYGWRRMKSVAGSFGFWFVLALAPEIVLSIDPPYRLLSLALVPLLLAWVHWSTRIWLWAHDAVPLENADLERRLAAIAERAGTPTPPLYRVGGDGSPYMNAVAIPSARHPAIGLGNGLLQVLDLDEAAAIYAHELSHIEQHSQRSLRRRQAVNRGLVLLAVVAGFAAPSVASSWQWLIPAVWPLILVAVLASRSRGRRQRETESDLRAAALCGDAEVVARALVKLHLHALVPRRLPVDLERGATHPSLARRIQALRAGAGATIAPAVGTPVVLSTARPGSVVVFDDERAHWFDGVPTDVPRDLASLREHAERTRSVVWNALQELRVATAGSGRALTATHRNGESWSVPLAPEQVSTVQRALDGVDGRLHRELGRRPFPDVQLIAVATLATVFWSRDVGALVLPAALAALWPGAAAIAALGTMACGAALLDALRAERWSVDVMLPMVVLAALGILGLWRAWHRARVRSMQDAPRERGSRLVILALGGLLAVVTLLAGVSAVDLSITDMAQSPIVGTLALASCGLAAALFTSSTRRARMSAAVLTAAGMLVGIPVVRSMHAFDARGASFAHDRVAAREVGRVALSPTTSSVRLSPDGHWFLARHFEPAAHGDARFPYTLGSTTGARREILALAAEFTGDDRLLTLQRDGDSLDLELQGVDSSGVSWRQTVPLVANPTLAVSPRDGAWVVSGIDASNARPLVMSGFIGSRTYTVRRLPPADAANVSGILRVGARLVMPVLNVSPRAGLLAAFGLVPFHFGFWELDAGGRRRIGEVDGFPRCRAADGEYAECVVLERGHGEVWTLGPHAELSRTATLPSGEVARASLGPGRRITFVRDLRSVVILDPVARRFTDVYLRPDSAHAIAASSVAGRVAVLWRGAAGTAVALYDIP